MRISDRTLALIGGTALTGALVLGVMSATAHAGSESTHEVPNWMNRVCQTEDSVNCWFDGGSRGHTGPIFVRQMPGRAHMVCVFYADHPKRDYCA